jgi:cell division protein FtsB
MKSRNDFLNFTFMVVVVLVFSIFCITTTLNNLEIEAGRNHKLEKQLNKQDGIIKRLSIENWDLKENAQKMQAENKRLKGEN